MLAGEQQPTGEVVVVDVRLCDVRDLDPAGVVDLGLDPVGVALWINNQCDLAVMDEIAAVAERWCLDDDDMHG